MTATYAPPMLEYALEYARVGELVLPLHTPVGSGRCSCRKTACTDIGKHPRTVHGLKEATADPNIIKSWWSLWPDANLGHRPPPGCIVLDVDPRNGGEDQLKAILNRFGPMPNTRIVLTGSGGWHLFYAYSGPVKGKLAPGIDIKSNSGYVVAPPSLHACGRRYEVVANDPVAPLPEYLTPYVAKVVAQRPNDSGVAGATAGREAGLLRFVAEAEEGERNRRLYWACRRAAEHGIDPNPLIDAAVDNGLDRSEAEKTCASAFTATEAAAS